jgi:hypothetical protein
MEQERKDEDELLWKTKNEEFRSIERLTIDIERQEMRQIEELLKNGKVLTEEISCLISKVLKMDYLSNKTQMLLVSLIYSQNNLLIERRLRSKQ